MMVSKSFKFGMIFFSKIRSMLFKSHTAILRITVRKQSTEKNAKLICHTHKVHDVATTSYRLPNQCSVFSAEAFAIWKGLEAAPRNDTRIVVLSDSLSVLAAIENGTSKHPWIQQIETIMQQRDVVLVWIPGHCGIAGNDLADAAARRANEKEPANMPVPKQDALRWVKERIRLTWEREWSGCRDVFLRRIKPNTIAGKDRSIQVEQRALTRLRIGHTRMTHGEHFKTGGRTCETCGVPLTVPHILLECRKYAIERANNVIDHNLGIALANDPAEENKIIKFLKAAKIFDQL